MQTKPSELTVAPSEPGLRTLPSLFPETWGLPRQFPVLPAVSDPNWRRSRLLAHHSAPKEDAATFAVGVGVHVPDADAALPTSFFDLPSAEEQSRFLYRLCFAGMAAIYCDLGICRLIDAAHSENVEALWWRCMGGVGDGLAQSPDERRERASAVIVEMSKQIADLARVTRKSEMAARFPSAHEDLVERLWNSLEIAVSAITHYRAHWWDLDVSMMGDLDEPQIVNARTAVAGCPSFDFVRLERTVSDVSPSLGENVTVLGRKSRLLISPVQLVGGFLPTWTMPPESDDAWTRSSVHLHQAEGAPRFRIGLLSTGDGLAVDESLCDLRASEREDLLYQAVFSGFAAIYRDPTLSKLLGLPNKPVTAEDLWRAVLSGNPLDQIHDLSADLPPGERLEAGLDQITATVRKLPELLQSSTEVPDISVVLRAAIPLASGMVYCHRWLEDDLASADDCEFVERRALLLRGCPEIDWLEISPRFELACNRSRRPATLLPFGRF